MRVALAQTNIIWENKAENYEKCEQFVKQAKVQEAELVFFPEMSFTGFSMNTMKIAEDSNQTVNEIKMIALKYEVGIGFGWVKKTDLLAENHYSVINNKGESLSDYVKIHPFSYGGEDRCYSSGNQIVQFEYGEMKFSTFICYDLRFPEIFQIASKKADVIVVPANWPEERELHWRTLLQARAIENQCYILGVNCVGTINGLNYSGCSACISPDGEILYEQKGKEELIVCDIINFVGEIRTSFPVKKDKRIELYHDLERQLSTE